MKETLKIVDREEKGRSVPVPWSPNAEQRDLSYFEFARPELAALVPLWARRVLDLGCGTGRLGELLKARQRVDVTGVEWHEEAARIARDEFGLKKIAVLSGVGTREYYRAGFGYELKGGYMVGEL